MRGRCESDIFSQYSFFCFSFLAVTIVQVPSETNISLKENGSVLLQFHVNGDIRRLNNELAFEGGAVEPNTSCSIGYPSQLPSKPLHKNLARVCDHAYWTTGGSHKYEMRLTNGPAARHITTATVTLKVFYFKNHLLQQVQASFVVRMEKTASTPPPVETTASVKPTSMATEFITTDTQQSTTQKSTTQTLVELTTTVDGESITTSTAPMSSPITSQVPDSTIVYTTDTLTSVSSPLEGGNSIAAVIVGNKQNIATLVVGVAMITIIAVEFGVITYLVFRSRKNRTQVPSDVDSARSVNLTIDYKDEGPPA